MTHSIGYLGWSRRGNLGDDVIEEALHEVLPGVSFQTLPHTPRELPAALCVGRRFGSFAQPLVLGGGTAIGRRNWRYILRAGGALLARGPRVMLGAGVEDPSFAGIHSFSGGQELRRWTSMLRTFDAVTVRGPQSARLLGAVGVDAEVVGDPALLLQPDTPLAPGDEVAINLGYGDDLWGHDHLPVEQELSRLINWCNASGLSVIAVSMSSTDQGLVEKVLDQVEPSARTSVRSVAPTTAQEFFHAVSRARIMVAERLHAQVLAAAANLPVVGIEYQPKVRDFLESVGMANRSVRTDKFTPGILIDSVRQTLEEGDAARDAISVRVAELRVRLDKAAQRLRAVATSTQEGAGERSTH